MGHFQILEYVRHQEGLWWNGKVTHLEAYLQSLVVDGGRGTKRCWMGMSRCARRQQVGAFRVRHWLGAIGGICH